MKKVELLILVLFIFSGCKKNTGDASPSPTPTPTPTPTTCDVSNVTYSTTVRNILTAYNCLSCHGASPTAPFSLHTYAAVKAKVTDGRLYGAINHSAGFTPMPQGGSKMSDCDIKKIKAWIDNGAPNN